MLYTPYVLLTLHALASCLFESITMSKETGEDNPSKGSTSDTILGLSGAKTQIALNKLGIKYTYVPGKNHTDFPAFFNKLDHKVLTQLLTVRKEGERDDTKLAEAVSILKASLDDFTWHLVEEFFEKSEKAFLKKAAIDVESSGSSSEGTNAYVSPMTSKRQLIQPGMQNWLTTKNFRQMTFKAIFGTRSRAHFHQQLMALKPASTNRNDIKLHNFTFSEAVKNLVYAGGSEVKQDPQFYIDIYLNSLPAHLKRPITRMPDTLIELLDMVEDIAVTQEACGSSVLRSTTSREKSVSLNSLDVFADGQAPLEVPVYEKFNAKQDDACLQGIVATLNSISDPKGLAAQTLQLAKIAPNLNAIQEASANELRRFEVGLQGAARGATSAQGFLNAVHTITPESWVRGQEHSRKRHFSSDEDELPSKRQHGAEDRWEKVDRSLAAINAQVSSLSERLASGNTYDRQREADSGAGQYPCKKCKQVGHRYTSCPTLQTKDGFKLWCTYCKQEGHTIGPRESTSCPALQKHKCKRCKQHGHTLRFCPNV